MEPNNWEKLVNDELLSSGVLTGAALLLADTAECIYSQGQLDDLPQQNWRPFVDLFSEDAPTETGLGLLLDKKVTKFVVFKKTQSSVYATSEGKLYNLVILPIPLGIIVCISKAPTLMSKTVMTAERFRSILN